VLRLPNQVRRFTRYLRRAKAVERSGQPTVTKAFLGPATRFNGTPENERRCTFVTLPLRRLRDVREASGGTLNEVFLTLCGGAVRRHLEASGEPPEVALTATVPAALPARPSPYGNGVTTLYVSLHSDEADPVARLAAVRRSLAATRRSTDLDPRLLPDWQRYPRLNGAVIRLMEAGERRGGRPAYNLIVSSVRGPARLSLAGVPVVELRSLGPLAGHLGLNITAWSYGDDFTVGIHAYRSGGADLERLGPLLLDELADLERRTAAQATAVPT
jgi:WS/DGAT/MGAT family acyltransferase